MREFRRDLIGPETRLAETWNRLDGQLFNGRLRRDKPIITFGSPAIDGAHGTFGVRRRDGAALLTLDERLITGLHPHLPPGVSVAARWRFVEDVLTHEAVHAVVHRAGRPWGDNANHDGAFAALAEHIGNKLGLPPAPGRWAWWPYCVRRAGYYVGTPTSIGPPS